MTLKPADLLRIRQLPLLQTAAADTFSRLTRSAFLQRFPRDAQLTAEGETFDEEGLLRLLRLARIGCSEIFLAQLKATGR